MPDEFLIAEAKTSLAVWPHTWRAQVLKAPPLIAPARQFTYPLQIDGEEDALARGAFQLLVTPGVTSGSGGNFLATCALGFTSPDMPTALFACPDPDELCAVAGGYAYIVDTQHPERSVHLPLKPVVSLRVLHGDSVSRDLLIFFGFHSILAWGSKGLAWQSARLSWEGVRLDTVSGDHLSGFGWNLFTDREVPFRLDLRTGTHTGGGF